MAEDRQRALEAAKQGGGGGGNSKNRLQYLLGQAEVFQHFIGPGGMKEEKKKGRKPGRHNTRSEFDEDAELLRDEEDVEAAKVRGGAALLFALEHSTNKHRSVVPLVQHSPASRARSSPHPLSSARVALPPPPSPSARSLTACRCSPPS